MKIFFEAIDEKCLIEVTFKSYEKGVITRKCIPFDYALSKIYHDGIKYYHFYDLDSSNGAHNLALKEEQLLKIVKLKEHFNPEDIVTWVPNWTYKRDWGCKS